MDVSQVPNGQQLLNTKGRAVIHRDGPSTLSANDPKCKKALYPKNYPMPVSIRRVA